MRVLHAPTLGWRNVDLREALAAATGLPVQIENSGRACALAQMWALRDDAVADPRRPGVRQRLGRRRRRRDHQRRGAARPAQHRRRVRPRAALARRAALLVRRERLLGSLRLEPGDAGALLRPHAEARRAGRRRRSAHFTIDDLIARARGGDAKAIAALAGDGPLSRARPGLGHQRRSIRRASTSAARSRWPGTSSTGTVRAALAERALTAAAAETEIARSPATNIRACTAPPRWWPRRRSPRRSSPELAWRAPE